MTITGKGIQTRSQLGELALEAAIALENAEKGKKSQLQVVNDFLNAIKSQLSENQSASVFRDVTLYPVYSYALAKTDSQEFGRAEDFRHHLIETIANYSDEATDSSEFGHMKRFCLAVHEALLIDLVGQRVSSTRHDERIR